MKLVQFKAGTDGNPVFINPDAVCLIQSAIAGPAGTNSLITCESGFAYVQEQPEEVAKALQTDE